MEIELSKLSDAELLLLLKHGDQVAFTEIYNRYWSLMYIHVFKMLRSEDDTKDILQELFSALWLKSSVLNPDTKLSGHLYISARNRVFNLIRQNKVKSDYITSVLQFISEADLDTLEHLEERDLVAAIESEIGKLPPKMRLIFEMSRKQNLTYKEIGKELGISEQTVRKQVQFALRILKPRLNAIGVGMLSLLMLK